MIKISESQVLKFSLACFKSHTCQENYSSVTPENKKEIIIKNVSGVHSKIKNTVKITLFYDCVSGTIIQKIKSLLLIPGSLPNDPKLVLKGL